MTYELFIARRYLFSKKSHNAINIISLIAVVGVAVTTLALVCTLSVFNGFQGLVADLFTGFDPQLRITPASGSTISAEDPHIRNLKQSKDIAVLTPVMEGQALITAKGQQMAVMLKGVDDNFMKQSHLDDALYGDGSPVLHADILEYAIPGITICGQLGLPANFEDPLQVYAPKRGERVNMGNPAASFNHDELQASGLVFSVHQQKYDSQYILCSLGFAQRLFDREGMYSALEVHLSKNGNRRNIEKLLGSGFVVKDRYEQQEDVFRIMKVEKLISYAFLVFILLVSCLNIIGSLSMLMIEKKNDVQTLRSLGATDGQIRRIFLLEGELITFGGAVIGVILGCLACYLQQEFGIIRMGDSDGSFIIDAYPVIVKWTDVLLILVTVMLAGSVSVWAAVRR